MTKKREDSNSLATCPLGIIPVRHSLQRTLVRVVHKKGKASVKYLLLFCGTPEDLKAWEALTEEKRLQERERVKSAQWIARYHSQIRRSVELQSPPSITSVRAGADGRPLVTDGPFLEGTEVIGGFVEMEVADLDEALQFARAWIGERPPHRVVQIWPIVEE